MKIKDADLLLVSLRLPFGGSPCPPDFCLFSDVITDTINDLLEDKSWDPMEVASDYTTRIPQEKKLDSSIPFATARALSVDVPCTLAGKADVFIDDIIACAVHLGDNLERIKAAPCTVIHAIAHQAEGETHLQRQNFISEDKNEAKGAPEEVKICLEWVIDTRQLLVSLPEHKFIAWSREVELIRTSQNAGSKQLQSMLGRLETIASIITPMGHFLNNIRSLQIKSERKGHAVRITKETKEDMILASKFLL